MTPNKAFILAAGFGKRLRPYTNERPKPMVSVNGKTLIDRTIDHLKKAGITEIVVNTHYRAEQLEDHLKKRTDIKIHLSHEPEILDTGGGIKKGLDYFKNEDFFVLSGDGLWADCPESPEILSQMREFWNPEKMDILMLLQDIETMQTTQGIGDYDLDQNMQATRSKNQTGRYMFTSIRINRTEIFKNTPNHGFSYLKLMDQAQSLGRLYGLINNGTWHHISTPKDLEAVNQLYRKTEHSE